MSQDIEKIINESVDKAMKTIKNSIIKDIMDKIKDIQSINVPSKSSTNQVTDIVVVLDRSGSMNSIRGDMEGALKEFIKEQKKVKGEALLTLVKFDDKIETTLSRQSLNELGDDILLEPRGMTALLDAVGSTINSLSSSIPKDNLVVFVVITDGYENASKEYSREQIKGLIEKQEKDNNWKFVFLGANQDSFTEAGKIGINMANTSNYHPDKIGSSVAGFSSNVSQYRVSRGTTTMGFTKEQQEDFEKPNETVASSDSSIIDDGGNKYKTIGPIK